MASPSPCLRWFYFALYFATAGSVVSPAIGVAGQFKDLETLEWVKGFSNEQLCDIGGNGTTTSAGELYSVKSCGEGGWLDRNNNYHSSSGRWRDCFGRWHGRNKSSWKKPYCSCPRDPCKASRSGGDGNSLTNNGKGNIKGSGG